MWIIAGHVTVDDDKRDAYVEPPVTVVRRGRRLAF